MKISIKELKQLFADADSAEKYARNCVELQRRCETLIGDGDSLRRHISDLERANDELRKRAEALERLAVSSQTASAKLMERAEAADSFGRDLHAARERIELLESENLRLTTRSEAAEAEAKELRGSVAELSNLAEERLVHANQLQTDIDKDQDGRRRLRERFGAKVDETFGMFVERMAHRAEASEARVKELERDASAKAAQS